MTTALSHLELSDLTNTKLTFFSRVHLKKGQPKEIEITKAEDSLGLTITGNNAGYCFIKKIREGSLIQQLGYIHVGDHIEKIDDVSVVGKRHVDVAKILQAIPTGTIFKMRLVEPLKAGFCKFIKHLIKFITNMVKTTTVYLYIAIIGPKQAAPIKKPDLGSGRKTIKLWSTGPATVEEAVSSV